MGGCVSSSKTPPPLAAPAAQQLVTAQQLDLQLLEAAKGGNVAAVRAALEGGANLGCKDKNGQTPLHIAASHGTLGVVRLLLERGADKEARDRMLRTPLHWAAHLGHMELVPHVCHVEVIRLLLACGADKEAKDMHGKTPLELIEADKSDDDVTLPPGKRAAKVANRAMLCNTPAQSSSGAGTASRIVAQPVVVAAAHSALVGGGANGSASKDKQRPPGAMTQHGGADTAKELYLSWFALADTNRVGRLAGSEAVAFLSRSELPQAVLKQVWDLAVGGARSSGCLSPPEFVVAMQLLSLVQQGVQLHDDHGVLLRTGKLPPPPPPRMRGLAAPQAAALPHVVPPSVAPGAGTWPALTQDEARRFGAAFVTWDHDRDGRVRGAEIVPYFKQSGCAVEAWFKDIWNLADADADGALTAPEFVTASYFLARAAEGRAPPHSLPPGIFPPPAALADMAQSSGSADAAARQAWEALASTQQHVTAANATVSAELTAWLASLQLSNHGPRLVADHGVAFLGDCCHLEEDDLHASGLSKIEAKRFLAAAAKLGSVGASPAATVPLAAAGVRTRVRALVVGIDAYASPVPGRLDNAVADATAVHEALSVLPGAASTLLLDCTKARFEAALKDFRDGTGLCKGRGMRVEAAPASAARAPAERTLGLLFFAGHGLQVGGRNYLVPSDFTVPPRHEKLEVMLSDTADACVSLERIEAMLDGAGVFAGSVLLDCCRNVPDFLAELGARRSLGGGTRALPTGMGDSRPSLANLMVTFATAPGTEALDRSSRVPGHSPFTAALLRALAAPRRLVDLNPFLTDEVVADSGGQQRPHVGGTYGTEAGNLLLG